MGCVWLVNIFQQRSSSLLYDFPGLGLTVWVFINLNYSPARIWHQFPHLLSLFEAEAGAQWEGREGGTKGEVLQHFMCYNISCLISRISFNAGTFHGFVNCNSDNSRKVKLPFHFIYELFAPWEFNFDNSYDFDKDPTKYGYRSPPFLNRPLLMIRLWSDHGKLPGK